MADLIKRIVDLLKECRDEQELFLFYGGILDFETGTRIDPDKIDPSNCNPRESMRHLHKAYVAALCLRELLPLYTPADEEEKNKIRTHLNNVKVIVCGGEDAINRIINDHIPDIVTYHKK